MRMNTRLNQKLRQAVRWLRKHFPATMPVTVRVVTSQPDLHGLCLVANNRARIRISHDTDDVMIESLIEEWCHVLRHGCPLPIKDDHDALFWAIMGAVTMAWRGE